jgi:cytidylate kinase
MKRSPRSASEIVDYQVRRWALEREESDKNGYCRPVVTVSHRHGAGGSALAETVAERLGYTCWNRALLGEIARQAGAPEAMFATLDERRRGFLDELIGVFEPKAKVTPWEYMRGLQRAVHAIAQHGSAVIVGRGAQHIVDPSAALRVLVLRPVEQRIAEVMAREGLGAREARKRVAEVDEDRRRFIREQYGRDNADPTGYDLVVNTGSMPVDCAAGIVVAAYRGRFGEPPRPVPAESGKTGVAKSTRPISQSGG